MSATVVAFVGLGGNLGDSTAVLQAAFAALARTPGIKLLKASRMYRTAPWGLAGQPDYLNAVAMIRTSLAPHGLLQAMLAIERDAGRSRSEDGSDRWGPRTLDLDLLLYGDQVVDEPGLQVPHRHLHERAFALVPLLEIAGDVVIPGVGPARDALAAMAGDGSEALPYEASPPAATR